jgi:hypothetical protein
VSLIISIHLTAFPLYQFPQNRFVSELKDRPGIAFARDTLAQFILYRFCGSVIPLADRRFNDPAPT